MGPPRARSLEGQRPGRQFEALTGHWPPSNRRVLILGLLAAVVMLAVAAAGLTALDTRVREGARAMERDLSRALELEEAAWHAGSADLFQDTLDPEADPVWRAGQLSGFETRVGTRSRALDLRLVEMQPIGDAFSVTVEVVPLGSQGGLASLIERRFYRTRGARWLRTTPRPEFWGPRRLTRSDHFVLHYRRLDGELVRSLLPDLEALHQQLRIDLGVRGSAEPIEIFLAAPGEANGKARGGTMVVNSPLILSGRTPEEGIKWTLGYAVTGRMLERALGPAADVGPWLTLAQAMADWEVQQWLTGSLSAELIAPETEAARYAVHYGTLETMRDTKPRFARFALPHVLMVDHIAGAYGRSSLGEFLRAMSHQPTWEGLVREGLGVTLEEFSDSWERYRDGWQRSP